MYGKNVAWCFWSGCFRKRSWPHLLHAPIVLLCDVWHIVNQLAGVIAGSVNVCRIAEIIRK